MVNNEQKAEQTTSGNNEGDINEAAPTIAAADKAAERMERATAALKAQNDRYENLLAMQRLGGKTNNLPGNEKQEEIDPKEYAKLILSGRTPIKK